MLIQSYPFIHEPGRILACLYLQPFKGPVGVPPMVVTHEVTHPTAEIDAKMLFERYHSVWEALREYAFFVLSKGIRDH